MKYCGHLVIKRKIWWKELALDLEGESSCAPWHVAFCFLLPLVRAHSRAQRCHLAGPWSSTGSDVWTGLGPHSFAGDKSWFCYSPRVDQGLTYTNQLHKWLMCKLNSIFIFLDNEPEWAGKKEESWVLYFDAFFHVVTVVMESQTVIDTLLSEQRVFHIFNKWLLIT